jgi:protein-disulfide isomerase
MSFVNKNIGKPSLVKPILVVVAVLLLVGGVYSFFGKKDSGNSESKSEVKEESKEATNEIDALTAAVKSSGLDQDDRVKNVGDVEKVVLKWIEANPHIILQSVANMQKKMNEDMVKNAQKNIGEKKSEIFDSASPSNSPKESNVTIVEFFDYACGYCKRAQATVDKLLAEDKKVKVIYKEFPILGQPSMEMSQVALAVFISNPDSYKKFHDALMQSNERGKAGALKIVSKIGLSSAKIEEVLKNQKEKIDGMIQQNLSLGSSIGINGTPGFVIGDELIPGAIDIAELKSKIAAVREVK